jgi:DUF4097 and DUF4098 domain-containing protein YvlB
MQTLLRCSVLIAAGTALMPRVADAQVYPDRIAVKAHAASVAYAHRAREQSRDGQTERTTKTFKLGTDGSLDLGNISGDITVKRGGGSDATVEIVKTAHGRDASDSRAQLGMVTVDVNESTGRAEVKTRYANGQHRNLNVSVDYNVTAPAGTRVTASSISGSIHISDIKGDVSANTISGDVRISGASRINTAHSISGSIEISDVKTDGSIEAKTVSGDVRLRHVAAHRAGGGSVSGEIQFEDIDCEIVAAQSTSGSITMSGALARHGHYELKTFSGDVRLSLSGNTGFEIEANSFSGDVRSDFPITTHGTVDSSGRRGNHRTILMGTFGDGSAVLNITTFSGSIGIAKK